MHIAHIALWTPDLDRAAQFWSKYFQASAGPPYRSARRPGFVSRFLTFAHGPAIELMTGPWISTDADAGRERVGWAHVAVSVGTRARVDTLAAALNVAGYLISPPRTTGDGFYEAVARTPDGAVVEIVADEPVAGSDPTITAPA